MICEIIKKDKSVSAVKIALGKNALTLDLDKPTDISKLKDLDTEKDLSKLYLQDGDGNTLADSAVAVTKQTALVHSSEVDANAISDLRKKLAGKTFTDDHKTEYVFDATKDIFVMKTGLAFNNNKEFTFSISFHPGYCILRNTDPETKAYPRTDALYYAYKDADNGYTLTMIAPTVPSQYAPAVINLKNGAPAKEAAPDTSSPDAVV